MKPLAIDLFCGLGGWTEGCLAEGYDVVGFDNERHQYWMPEESPEADGSKNTKPVEKRGWTQGCAITLGMEGAASKPRTRLASYPAQLVLQDVLTIHGKQFKDAAVIVASPPCQAFSYRAMPWKLGKAQKPDDPPDWWELPESEMSAQQLNEWRDWKAFFPAAPPSVELFNACFRIQREACEAAGRYIPMVVENVKGAQPWVGPAKAHFGSFYLWGDVGMVGNRVVAGGLDFGRVVAPMGRASKVPGFRFDGSGGSFQTAAVNGAKNQGGSWFAIGSPGQANVGQNPDGRKTTGHANIRDGHTRARHLTNQRESDAIKNGKDWFGSGENCSLQRRASSKSDSRKAASAQIAKIPFALSSYIARAFRP